MKNTLQVLMKKDIKVLLPGIVMFLMAGIALFIMSMFGVLTDNGDFTVTVLYIFIIALAVVLVYNTFKGANLYRKNLSDEEYITPLQNKGITARGFALGKMIWTWIITALTLTFYLILLAISIFSAFAKLSAINEEIGKNSLFNDLDRLIKSADFLNVFLSYAALLLVVAGITAFVYLAFELCYKYFIRGKYAVVASTMTVFCMFWIIWKIFDFIVPETGIASIVGTAVFATVVCIICVVIHLATAPKKYISNNG